MRESLYAQYERELLELNKLIDLSGNQGDQNLLPVSTKLTQCDGAVTDAVRRLNPRRLATSFPCSYSK